MGKKITNPLREGLASKVYLASYGKGLTGYEIAKRIYGIDKFPPTAKIYPAIKELRSIGALSEENRSNSNSLFEELKNRIEGFDNEKLSELEDYVLLKVLDSDIFREYVDSNIQAEDLQNKDADAIDILERRLQMPAMAAFVAKMRSPYLINKFEPTTIGEFDKFLDQFIEKAKGIDDDAKNAVKETTLRTMEAFGAGVMPSNEIKRLVSMGATTNTYGMVLMMDSVPSTLLLKIIRLDPIMAFIVGLFRVDVQKIPLESMEIAESSRKKVKK